MGRVNRPSKHNSKHPPRKDPSVPWSWQGCLRPNLILSSASLPPTPSKRRGWPLRPCPHPDVASRVRAQNQDTRLDARSAAELSSRFWSFDLSSDQGAFWPHIRPSEPDSQILANPKSRLPSIYSAEARACVSAPSVGPFPSRCPESFASLHSLSFSYSGCWDLRPLRPVH